MQLSKKSPKDDPIILYLQGGPGASSMYGLMIQWGSQILPFQATDSMDNPAKLNERANVIFLDNPLGVGFSEPGQPGPDNTRESSRYIIEFLSVLRKTDFNGHKFDLQKLHVYGPSFGGHYVSALGLAIATSDPAVQDLLKIDSLIMGNPSFDEIRQRLPVYQMICDPKLTPNAGWLMTDAECKSWMCEMPKCEAAVDACRQNLALCDENEIEGNACKSSSPFRYWQVS